jgi:hypothetical protein
VPLPAKYFAGGSGGSGSAPERILSRMLAAKSKAIADSTKPMPAQLAEISLGEGTQSFHKTPAVFNRYIYGTQIDKLLRWRY